MVYQYWTCVCETGPTLNQHWFNLLCLLLVNNPETRGADPMLSQGWSSVCDAGPTLKQHSFNTSNSQGKVGSQVGGESRLHTEGTPGKTGSVGNKHPVLSKAEHLRGSVRDAPSLGESGLRSRREFYSSTDPACRSRVLRFKDQPQRLQTRVRKSRDPSQQQHHYFYYSYFVFTQIRSVIYTLRLC